MFTFGTLWSYYVSGTVWTNVKCIMKCLDQCTWYSVSGTLWTTVQCINYQELSGPLYNVSGTLWIIVQWIRNSLDHCTVYKELFGPLYSVSGTLRTTVHCIRNSPSPKYSVLGKTLNNTVKKNSSATMLLTNRKTENFVILWNRYC